MTVSGYDGQERALIGRLVTDLGKFYVRLSMSSDANRLSSSIAGGTFMEQMGKKINYLILHPQSDAGAPKVAKGREWGIPVVGIEWLYACLLEVSP